MADVHDLSTIQIRTVDTLDDALDFKRWLGERRDVLAFDTETTGLQYWNDTVRLVQFGDWDTGWVFRFDDWKGLIRSTFAEYTGLLTAHNATFDIRFLCQHLALNPALWPWSRTDDTMTFAFLLDPLQSKALKTLTGRLISPRAVSGQKHLDEDMKRGKWNWATVPIDLPSYNFYAGLDTVLSARLHGLLRPQVMARYPVAYELEQSLSGILTRMMMHGLYIDKDYSRRTKDRMLHEAEEILHELQTVHGIENPSSTGQVLQALLKGGADLTERTATGRFKLDKAVLEGLTHPIAQSVVDYRNRRKWAETYFEKFLTMPDSNGVLHPEIRQFQARTGRMSVADPSMQNLPRGPVVRDAVIAPEGFKLIASDFSGVEARIFSDFAAEEGMIEAIKSGVDLHTYVAQKTYNTDIPTPAQRQVAKNTNFCTIYGGGAAKVAQTAGISLAEATAFVEQYHKTFPGIKRFQMKVVNESRARGRERADGRPCIETYLGTHLYVEDPDKAYKLVNYAIQGSARLAIADRMVALDNAGVMDYAQLVVHDEVDFCIPDAEVDEVSRVVAEVMPDLRTFRVPLTCEVSKPAKSWGQAK